MTLQILPTQLKNEFKQAITFDPIVTLQKKAKEQLPVDYFQFYHAISSVYSSKIEGENIDFDSFFKHKFLKVEYKPDYTKRADDLYGAYEFIYQHPLSETNVWKAHALLSHHFLPKRERGKIRNNPMFVLNEADRIEYIACNPFQVRQEIAKLFDDISYLQQQNLSVVDAFYYAALIHLIFVKIHPLQDGNGRTARLLEKWFLLEQLGEQATAIELEKNYYVYRKDYYNNIRKIGLEYETLNYDNALGFLLMTINSLR